MKDHPPEGFAGQLADEHTVRTAKAAIAGLSRALAVDYDRGIQMNAAALGSIATERYQAFLPGQQPGQLRWHKTRCARCTRSAGPGAPPRSPPPSAAPNAGSRALTHGQHACGHGARRRLLARAREDSGSP